jgi:molecular chaperone DnaK (HSP70)
MSGRFRKVIGIDLGTTYSAIAVFDTYEEDAVIVKDRDQMEETTPSVVSLDHRNQVIVGHSAKACIENRPQDTIIEIKREMGEMFREETLHKYNAKARYTVEDPVRVRFGTLADDWMLPQEISAFILMKIKEIAEKEIGEEICDAVVTVPAYFTEKQKKATEEAALLAGLYPRQLIPEPTAAAICYGLDKMEEDKKIYMVYDLGGGTFDVSIIEVEGQTINVLATSGDPRLGGGDFDDAIVSWAVRKLISDYDIDIRQQRQPEDHLRLMARLKLMAEQAKIQLSTYDSTTLDLPFLDRAKAPSLTLTREEFVAQISDILNKSKNYVDLALQIAEKKKGVQRTDIDAILLVGGSSKIPIIKSMLLEYFQKDEDFVRSEVNPDTVVARGAAIMACAFEPTPPPYDITKHGHNLLMNPEFEGEVQVNLITEHTLSVGVQNDLVQPIITQGTGIPVEKSEDGFINPGPIPNVQVVVYQGEGKYVYDNTVIGSLNLGPMDPKPQGYHKFRVTFKLDVNGLLTMVVDHLNEAKSYKADFKQPTGVGGEEALAVLRQKILDMYAHSAVQPPIPAPSPTSQPTIPAPIPCPQTAPAEVQSPPEQTEAPAPAAAQEPSGTSAPQTPAPPQPAPVSPAPVPEPAATSTSGSGFEGFGQPGTSPAPQPEGGAVPTSDAPTISPASPMPTQDPPGTQEMPLEATVDVPAQFKQTVRRARRQLSKKPDGELLAALNAFIQALNAGGDEEMLEDLGDELADIYDDARRR